MQLTEYEKKHNAFLRENGAECTVLLKKDGSFPLPMAGAIALYGSGGVRTIKGGTGSGEVNSRFFVNVMQGLEDSGFEVTTKYWYEAYERELLRAKKEFRAVVRKRARAHKQLTVIEAMGAVMPEPEYEIPLTGEGDTAIYVLSRISGEGNDREPVPGDILLSRSEIRDILACSKKYSKFMLVINAGGPVDLSEVASVGNILVLSQLGVETGHILADILLGKSVPSGKLTTTWYDWKDDPIGERFGDINDTEYREGIYVGYRYFDSMDMTPRFPFGYGLSYTDFSFEMQEASLNGTVVDVAVAVRNIGSASGKEVLQLYLSSPWGKLDRPYQELAGFAKTEYLQPGESGVVHIVFDLKDHAGYEEEGEQYLLEKGEYVLRLGTGSRDTVTIGKIILKQDFCVRKAAKCLGEVNFSDDVPKRREEDQSSLPVLGTIDENSFGESFAPYIPDESIEPKLESLSDEDLALINMGAFSPKGGLASIIGEASRDVAGAAGQTTFRVKGVKSLVMADGPAGVRISKECFRDSDGIPHDLQATMPESLREYMPRPVLWLMERTGAKPKPGDERFSQYATAIPIGTAIAQSFNLDLAEKMGDIVGSEMELFGVHLWLAPALNIHRSIRCGRNFEYFSEDPLVSGLFAAALTKGVQAHPGCGTTIKHYAANNQETNRYNSNSIVSERAMRELYLKGFEIAVKQSQPYALMTSYNLLNGIHTSEHRGLIEEILRKEYGYQGIVMTDWVVNGGTMNRASIHPRPYPSNVAMAGGDLFMPGSANDYKELLNGIRQKKVTRKQLLINASRVYRLAEKLVK